MICTICRTVGVTKVSGYSAESLKFRVRAVSNPEQRRPERGQDPHGSAEARGVIFEDSTPGQKQWSVISGQWSEKAFTLPSSLPSLPCFCAGARIVAHSITKIQELRRSL